MRILGLVESFETMNRADSARAGFGRVGSGRFIVLDDSDSPNMIMKMYFNYFLFF